MNIIIRPETVQNEELLNMLKYTAANMVAKLANQNVTLADNAIKIWIKGFGDKTKLFPKIEFDYNNQELQYDLTLDGNIREVHFKSFIHTKNGTKRYDLERNQADPFLIQIDTILRQ